MNDTLAKLELKLAALNEVDRIYGLKEASLEQQFDLIVDIRSKLLEKILALDKIIAQHKGNPVADFIRDFSK